MNTVTEKQRSPQILKDQRVLRLWLAQSVSSLGDFIALFAIFAVVTFKLHGKPTQIAEVVVAFMIPMAIVSPLAGVLVDRWNVKRAMIASDIIRLFLAFALAFTSDLQSICILLASLSTVSSFFGPAQSVLLVTLVSPKDLLAGNAIFAQSAQVIQIASPALAGFLVQWSGANTCFYLDAVSFGISAALIGSIGADLSVPPRQMKIIQLLSDFRDGIRWVLTSRRIISMLAFMTVATFGIRCFSSLIAIYVRDILAESPALFGLLSTMLGLGLITGTQCIRSMSARLSKETMVIAGMAGMGLSIIVLALAGNLPVSIASLIATGFCVALVLIPAQTLVQIETPHAMLGRVSSSLFSLLAVAQIASVLLAGSLAQGIGIKQLYVGSGSVLVLFAVIAAVRWND